MESLWTDTGSYCALDACEDEDEILIEVFGHVIGAAKPFAVESKDFQGESRYHHITNLS